MFKLGAKVITKDLQPYAMVEGITFFKEMELREPVFIVSREKREDKGPFSFFYEVSGNNFVYTEDMLQLVEDAPVFSKKPIFLVIFDDDSSLRVEASSVDEVKHMFRFNFSQIKKIKRVVKKQLRYGRW